MNLISPSVRQDASPTLTKMKKWGPPKSANSDTWALGPSLSPGCKTRATEHYVGGEATEGRLGAQMRPHKPYRNHIRATTAPATHRTSAAASPRQRPSQTCLTGVLLQLSAEAAPPPHPKAPRVPASVVLGSYSYITGTNLCPL